MKTLEGHYPMIQFLIISDMCITCTLKQHVTMSVTHSLYCLTRQPSRCHFARWMIARRASVLSASPHRPGIDISLVICVREYTYHGEIVSLHEPSNQTANPSEGEEHRNVLERPCLFAEHWELMLSLTRNISPTSGLLGTIRPSKKKHVFPPDFYKKGEQAGGFFGIYYFLLHAFFTHYYLPPGIRWSS